MLRATDEERDAITDYFLWQSPEGTEVRFLQKVYSEAVLDHRHDVWDVHSSDGRWWVITSPTNLYSQDQFPNLDLAVTFNIGLCLRIPRSRKGGFSRRQAAPLGDVIQQVHDIDEALSQAHALPDYQGMGVRCREALLAFIAAAQDVMAWLGEDLPKRADFRAWNELIWNTVLAGSDQTERRRLVKTAMAEAWVFSNWLTHAKSATWRDAEAASMSIDYCLGMATNILILHLRGVPDQCPDCRSRRLEPEEGAHTSAPELVIERPACVDCGWRGEPIVVDERGDEEVEQFITREGWKEDGCVVPTVPLMELVKPGGRRG
jgi:hypothetical protein